MGRLGRIAVSVGLLTAAVLWAPTISLSAPISVGSKLGAADNFALLALSGGTMSINSATSITGNVGYSAGVTSTTNQKVDSFIGTAYVHSTATFNYAAATFAPSGGIVMGGAANTLLNQVNTDAAAAAVFFAGLPATASLGNLTTSQSFTAAGDVNVYDISSINLNTATWTLTGDYDDLFLFRVAGSLDWSDAQTVLNGVSPNQVLFYFPNASAITINKADNIFIGTILAPTGSVEYHNPATFNGAIIAKNIDVHSDFNISKPHAEVPEGSSFFLLASGLACAWIIGRAHRRGPRYQIAAGAGRRRPA